MSTSISYTFENSTKYYFNDEWNKSTEFNTVEEFNNNTTSLFSVNNYLRGECKLEVQLISDGDNLVELEQTNLTFDFVGEEPEINTQVYCGYLKKSDGTNLENKIVKVKSENPIIGDKSIIVNDEVIGIVKNNGYWKVEIKYEDIKLSKLYWNINGIESITNFSTETNYYTKLERLRK